MPNELLVSDPSDPCALAESLREFIQKHGPIATLLDYTDEAGMSDACFFISTEWMEDLAAKTAAASLAEEDA